MRILVRLVLSLMCVSSSAGLHAEIYQSVDKVGNVFHVAFRRQLKICLTGIYTLEFVSRYSDALTGWSAGKKMAVKSACFI
ncbi:hypothetical protein [Methylophaga sp.]|uniref:hypothetical protein n=1 Tax=Methylophaga sp. TaxID=2024840 RepID=UPI003F6A19B7